MMVPPLFFFKTHKKKTKNSTFLYKHNCTSNSSKSLLLIQTKPISGHARNEQKYVNFREKKERTHHLVEEYLKEGRIKRERGEDLCLYIFIYLSVPIQRRRRNKRKGEEF